MNCILHSEVTLYISCILLKQAPSMEGFLYIINFRCENGTIFWLTLIKAKENLKYVFRYLKKKKTMLH